MPAAISEALRHKILHEYERLGNISKVARNLNLSCPTVRKWLRRFNQAGHVKRASSTGRKPVLTKLVAQQAMEMLLSGKYSGANEVAVELHKRGLTDKQTPIHRTTVARHAKAVGKALGSPIKPVQGPPQKQLSPQNMEKRLEFCRSSLKRTWRNVMLTDRKRFTFLYPGVRIHKVSWVKAGQKRIAPKVNHAMCVNLYAGITPFGATKPHLVAGTSKMIVDFKNKKGGQAKNITMAEYEHVLLSTLLKEGDRLFRAQGVTSWVLQQDNAPSHKKASAKAVDAWNKSCKGSVVTILPDWPPNSPDLNLIENVWAYVQHEANKAGCKTFVEFQEKVISLIQNLPKGFISNLYKSMRPRLHECIEKNGEKTRY